VAIAAQKLKALARGFLFLVLFQLAGEVLVRLLSIPFPGPVAGMVLLLVALQFFSRGVPDWLSQTASRLLGLLSLFFLPASVGIFYLQDRLASQWPALVAAVLAATLISLAITALLMNRLLARDGNGH